jgi:hypothetical protein
MFTISFPRKKGAPYIRHPSYENLFVLPYINCRLVFAELVARALSRGGFDVVAVDLLHFMQAEEYLDLPINGFPWVSSLIIGNASDQFRTYHFVPNDAACAAAYMTKMDQSNGAKVELHCVDDSHLITYPGEIFSVPEAQFTDDYFALTDGVEAYFSPAYEKLDDSWRSSSEAQRFYWQYRARVVAARLAKLLRKGKKTLFVCNYRLWWLVNKILKSGDLQNHTILSIPWTDRRGVLLFQDPAFIWTKGSLDDYPAVVLRFFDAMEQGTVDSFDKLKSLNSVMSELIDGSNRRNMASVSIRRLAAFRGYLLTYLGAHCRITPTLTRYLYRVAVSFMGRSFARELAGKLLEYPRADENLVRYLLIKHDKVIFSPEHFELPHEFQQRVLNPGPTFDGKALPDHYLDLEKEREKLVSLTAPYLTRAEASSLKGERGTEWALEKEYLFHARVNGLVHRVARRKAREFKSARSWGTIKDGIDWKATIRSRARGENGLYVRESRRWRQNKLNVNIFTPTIFIFDSKPGKGVLNSVQDANITQRYIFLGNKHLIRDDFPKADLVYSIFITRYQIGYMCENHIRKESIQAILFLCTQPWMGLERYKRITARPPRFQCRTSPDEDQELMKFHYPEKLVACGVKYAEEVVLVVCEEGWKPSAGLYNFARARSIRLHQLRLSYFSPDLIERMKQIHFISTPLKKHPEREAIVERFLPDFFDS